MFNRRILPLRQFFVISHRNINDNLMANIILFDNQDIWVDILPMTYTRPLADIRVGILTIREKWQRYFPDASISILTRPYLSKKYPTVEAECQLFIAGHVFPNRELANTIAGLQIGEALKVGDELIAYCGTKDAFDSEKFVKVVAYNGEIDGIHLLYDIFQKNDAQLKSDFRLITTGRQSQPVSNSCTVIGPRMLDDGLPTIFIEEGASVEAAILNTTAGPIYIGKDATVMEGTCIRAPFAACEHAQVNMGTKIYGATTLGPFCKVGGELNNVVMIGYSNKAHDGFLGNAVIGEWCNIGAGTNASNLKNDYTEIKLWNYRTHRFMRTGLQFCGLIMGDHSKAGINCMFNTATVVGVGVNIHGAGFPRNFVASFLEGSVAGYSDVSVNKFFDTAKRMMSRRGKELGDEDKAIFESIYNIADNYK